MKRIDSLRGRRGVCLVFVRIVWMSAIVHQFKAPKFAVSTGLCRLKRRTASGTFAMKRLTIRNPEPVSTVGKIQCRAAQIWNALVVDQKTVRRRSLLSHRRLCIGRSSSRNANRNSRLWTLLASEAPWRLFGSLCEQIPEPSNSGVCDVNHLPENTTAMYLKLKS